jgi:hypothetical protein
MIKVKLQGSKTNGYVLTVLNKEDDFIWDVALKFEELKEILKVLKSKKELND